MLTNQSAEPSTKEYWKLSERTFYEYEDQNSLVSNASARGLWVYSAGVSSRAMLPSRNGWQIWVDTNGDFNSSDRPSAHSRRCQGDFGCSWQRYRRGISERGWRFRG